MTRDELDELKSSLHELSRTNKKLVLQQSFGYAFMRGVVTAIGATLGAAIVLALAAGILRQLVTVDFFKPAAEQLLPYIDKATTTASPGDDITPSPRFIEPSPSPDTIDSTDNAEESSNEN